MAAIVSPFDFGQAFGRFSFSGNLTLIITIAGPGLHLRDELILFSYILHDSLLSYFVVPFIGLDELD